MYASVIIPTHNQSERLYLTLVSFEHQASSRSNFEVIVVDDGSEDETAEIVSSYSAGYHLKYYRQQRLGRASARNVGASFAEGDILIFNDCDRAVCHEFIDLHLQRHLKHPGSVVIGSIYELFFGNLAKNYEKILDSITSNFSPLVRYAREYNYAKVVTKIYNDEGETNYHIPWLSFFSGNVSVSHRQFLEAGRFDENFIGWGFEHFELGLRLYDIGAKYIYEKGARNYHFAHRRDNNFYRDNLRASFAYFADKHRRKEVVLLEKFFKGELSIQEYEYQINDFDIDLNKHEPILFTGSVDF